jgi:hypothetical protein
MGGVASAGFKIDYLAAEPCGRLVMVLAEMAVKRGLGAEGQIAGRAGRRSFTGRGRGRVARDFGTLVLMAAPTFGAADGGRARALGVHIGGEEQPDQGAVGTGRQRAISSQPLTSRGTAVERRTAMAVSRSMARRGCRSLAGGRYCR